jgi:hypothetical protein
MERIKEFKHYVVIIALVNGAYLIRDYTAERMDELVSISKYGHRYELDRKTALTLHGWYPWLKENRWNAWRQVYNMLYRYFVPCALLYYEEPATIDKNKSILPMTWSIKEEKWTPALVQAVNLSVLEERYTKRLNFGNLKMNWKIMLIIGVVAVVLLLLLTGRLPI